MISWSVMIDYVLMSQRGNTCMHIAVRSRSKRIMELLLKNPKDSRLLYKPNRDGETPYQLDQAHERSLISQVQGASTFDHSSVLSSVKMYMYLLRSSDNTTSGISKYIWIIPVWRHVFLSGNLNDTESMRGYELYSSTIADVLSEPSLSTPITVGLYAKWGSGKSFLIEQLISMCM